METFYVVGTFAEMLKTYTKYLIKTVLEIAEIKLAKAFRKNRKKNRCCGKNPKILENRVKQFEERYFDYP